MLASVGIPAREVLRSATETPARALGRADVLGHLRPGAAADAVVLRDNPLEDVRAMRRVEAVYLGGRRVAGSR
jgi:enamidase